MLFTTNGDAKRQVPLELIESLAHYDKQTICCPNCLLFGYEAGGDIGVLKPIGSPI